MRICEDVCNYFEENLELKALKPRLLGRYTASELAEVLFEVWKCATEEQFTWFVGTFEEKMQLKNEQFFNAALKNSKFFCDTYEC